MGGKVEGGALKPGTKMLLVPSWEPTSVKGLEVDGQVRGREAGSPCQPVTVPHPLPPLLNYPPLSPTLPTLQPSTLARAGDSVDVTLQGIEPGHLCSGAVLCHADYPIPLVTKFEARVVVLDVASPILKGHTVTLHAHTAREAGGCGCTHTRPGVRV